MQKLPDELSPTGTGYVVPLTVVAETIQGILRARQNIQNAIESAGTELDECVFALDPEFGAAEINREELIERLHVALNYLREASRRLDEL